MTKTQISIRRALKDKNWGGILAQDIREKLKEETGVLRPVCGARLTDSAMFALMHDGIPDRKTVEKANDAWEKARQAAKAADDAHSAKEQELLPEKSALMTAAEEHLSVSLCDDLKKGTILPDAVASCDAQIAEARAAFGQAAADMAAKEKALSEKKKKITEDLTAAMQQELADALRKLNNARDAATVARTSTENKKKQLQDHPESRESAMDMIAALESRAAALQKETAAAREKLSLSLREQAENEGNLKGALPTGKTGKKRGDAPQRHSTPCWRSRDSRMRMPIARH